MSDPVSQTMAIHVSRGARIAFDYLNYRGAHARRQVEVGGVFWGATEWHPTPGWLLSAFDLEKREWRQFAMKDMANVEAEKQTTGYRTPSGDIEDGYIRDNPGEA